MRQVYRITSEMCVEKNNGACIICNQPKHMRRDIKMAGVMLLSSIMMSKYGVFKNEKNQDRATITEKLSSATSLEFGSALALKGLVACTCLYSAFTDKANI